MEIAKVIIPYLGSMVPLLLVENKLWRVLRRGSAGGFKAYFPLDFSCGLFAFWEDFPSTFEEGHLLLLFRFVFQRRNYALKGKKSYGSVEFKDTPL